MKYSETEIAYLAGMIDGEGTITLSKNPTSKEFRLPRLGVASTSKELVDYLHDTFEVGCVSTKKTYEDHHKNSYTWIVRYNPCIKLLELVLPYLQEESKIRRAELIVNHWKNLTPRNGKYSDDLKERKLKFQKHFFHPDKFPNWNSS